MISQSCSQPKTQVLDIQELFQHIAYHLDTKSLHKLPRVSKKLYNRFRNLPLAFWKTFPDRHIITLADSYSCCHALPGMLLKKSGIFSNKFVNLYYNQIRNQLFTRFTFPIVLKLTSTPTSWNEHSVNAIITKVLSFCRFEETQIIGLSFNSINGPNESDLEKLIRSNPLLFNNLEFLKITGYKTSKKIQNLLVSACPNLRALELETTIPKVTLQKFSQYKNLEYIKLIDTNPDLTPDIIENFAKNNPRLSRINIDECQFISDYIIQTIAKAFNTRLTHLNIALPQERHRLYIYPLSSLSLQALAHYCKNLEFLDLSNWELNEACINLLINNFSNLNKLVLERTKPRSHQLLTDLILSKKDRLRELTLIEDATFSNYPNKIFSAIAQCHRLEKLTLRHSNKISKDTFRTILENNKALIHLNLQTQTNLSETLIQIAPHLSHIEALDLSFCRYLSEESIFAILENCTKLKYLNISYTKISNRLENKLKKYKSKTNIFNSHF